MTQRIYCGENTTIKKTPVGRQRNKNPKQQPMDWLGEPYNHSRGETSLWIAVITQAMMDALSHARNSEAEYHKHEAIRWLTENSQDFVTVCLASGMDPGYVRRKAKRALIAPKPWRAEAGKGKRYLERKAYRQNIKNRLKTARQSLREESSLENDAVILGPWSSAAQAI